MTYSVETNFSMFTLTTEKGSKIEMDAGMTLQFDLDDKRYEVSIIEK